MINLNEEVVKKIISLERKGVALVFVLFPMLFVAAQIMHPDIFHYEMITSGAQWIEHFRGQKLLHLAHFFEFMSAFLLIIMGLHYKKVLFPYSPRLVTVGVYMVFIGSLMLLANKSALCLTISGFDTLSNMQLQQIIPALDVLLQKKSFLAVLWLLPLLPIGYVLISIALFRTKHVPSWQSTLIIIGSLMLANPEVEIINFFASFFLAGGLIPYGIKQLISTKNIQKVAK